MIRVNIKSEIQDQKSCKRKVQSLEKKDPIISAEYRSSAHISVILPESLHNYAEKIPLQGGLIPQTDTRHKSLKSTNSMSHCIHNNLVEIRK